jgi:uncharacterized membrane protein
MAVFRGPGNDDEAREEDGRRPPATGGEAHAFWWVVLQYWRRHRGKLLGVVIGLSVGLGIRYLGFVWTLFIAMCGVVGYFIGRRLDESNEDILELLDRVLPPGRG